MSNYIKADLYRIIHKKRRWIIYAITCIVCIILGVKDNSNLYEAVSSMSGELGILGLVMGIIEIAYVYGDDFKARTMQIAIGSGLPRQKVVHAKWLEFMIVAAVDVLAYTILGLLACLIWYGTDGGFDVRSLVVSVFIAWLTLTVEIGCVMFIMFVTQATGMATLVFLILYLGDVITMLGLDKVIETLNLSRFHIQNYFLSSMLNALSARLVLGHFSWSNALGILIYMMIGFALASILFKKKELEF